VHVEEIDDSMEIYQTERLRVTYHTPYRGTEAKALLLLVQSFHATPGKVLDGDGGPTPLKKEFVENTGVEKASGVSDGGVLPGLVWQSTAV
jgi:hypothetical protein